MILEIIAAATIAVAELPEDAARCAEEFAAYPDNSAAILASCEIPKGREIDIWGTDGAPPSCDAAVRHAFSAVDVTDALPDAALARIRDDVMRLFEKCGLDHNAPEEPLPPDTHPLWH